MRCVVRSVNANAIDPQMEVVEPAPRPRKKERKPTVRQQSPIAPGISPVFGTPFPMAPTPVPPPKQQRAAPAPPPPPAFRMTSGKPAIGTVPWIPTPSVPSAIKVSVGKSDRVNPEVASKFATTIDGKLLWFQQPPIDVVQPPKPMHSLKYLEWKLAQGRREVEVEPPRKRARVEGAEAGAELLESVTQGMLDNLGSSRKGFGCLLVEIKQDWQVIGKRRRANCEIGYTRASNRWKFLDTKLIAIN